MGVILSVLFMLVYMAGGILIIRCMLPRVRFLARIWLGLALGIILEMWLPYLSAYLCEFSLRAHLYSLLPLLILCCVCLLLKAPGKARAWDEKEKRLLTALLCTALPLTLIGGYLQITHNVMPVDGTLHVGQSTYGDLNLHLGIITSFRNAKVPVDYSIFPGELLSYPFLTDSLSATFMLFGASLQFAVDFPGIIMMLLTFSGFILLAERIGGKKSVAVLSCLLFFINGGLGFFYSLDMAGARLGSGADNELQSGAGLLQRLEIILDGWYQTPANHAEFGTYNLRWSNVIADMMIPQRTTLGGWCQLLPCLYLLWEFASARRFDEGLLPEPQETSTVSGRWTPADPRLVILLGVWGGMLPMVHTHSFLALALASAGILLYDQFLTGGRQRLRTGLFLGLLGCVILMALLKNRSVICRLFDSRSDAEDIDIPLFCFFIPAGIGAGLCAADIILDHSGSRLRRLAEWAVYGAAAAVLCLPQLLTWTFSQTASSDHFLSLQFNWVNNAGGDGMRDGYLWFYIKNIGLPFLLLLIALLEKDPRRRMLACGAFAVFIPAEFIRFQPNEYDNNKLFYVWYMLCAVIAADYAVQIFGKLKGLRGRWALAVLACIVFFTTGSLSIARECKSDFQTFSTCQVEAADFIEHNTPEHSVFITAWQNHIDPASALAGRTVVCGPDLWLYWHGFDTQQRHDDIRRFYADPASNTDVIGKYGVDYIYVDFYSYESEGLIINEDALNEMYEPVYEGRGENWWERICIWKVDP
ncbi:MAG: hypothetical protein CW338_00290 [Clostridiales bacterium]|nr:hypothetical protein [Clostridiales bacterium]